MRKREFDHPAWMIDACCEQIGRITGKLFSAANNDRAPMWLRCNPSHGSAADYVARLQDAVNIAAELIAAAPQAVQLLEPQPVEQLPGFFEGHVSVQDAAAQLAAPWLLAELRGNVLDACAAPGGKSGHLLEIGGDNIVLTSIDSDAGRLQGIEENLERLGMAATIRCGDASNPEEWWDGELFRCHLAGCAVFGQRRYSTAPGHQASAARR